MIKIYSCFLASFGLSIMLVGCSGPTEIISESPAPVQTDSVHIDVERPLSLDVVPSARREFRAAWIASVANIDWPSEPGLSVERQQGELRTMLDQAVSLGLNGIVLQVRPMADALYDSSLEPWSFFLTGEQGTPPEPLYDPLEFAIDASHRRGLELHAWVNPFRAGHPTSEGIYDSSHVSLAHPEWVKEYGELKWMDPGDEEARGHSLAVVADIVRRYDLDGLHMDDYFYPYAITDSLGREVPFPDSTSWNRAQAEGWDQSLSDWRRSNVNGFIEALYDTVKAIKPWVKVGISPFGIWRPGHPEEVTGFDAYEGLYADARLWLNQGWMDYLAPQLYWKIESEGQPYGSLLRWWISENDWRRHIWPGMYASRVILEGRARWEPDELLRQVELTRRTDGTDGNIHFSMKALMDGPGADRLLADSAYAEPALVPPTYWLAEGNPGRPLASARRLGGRLVVDLVPGEGTSPFVWHVRELRGASWTIRTVPAWQQQLRWSMSEPELLVVSAVDRLGLEGPAAMLRTNRAR